MPPRLTGKNHGSKGGGGSKAGDRGGGKAGGGGGGGGGGRGKSDESRETGISKAMSYVLRHGAQKEGLRLDERGYADVADLLSWPRLASLNVTFPELQSIVETNAKQRFALIPASDLDTTPNHTPPHDPLNPAHYRIRATQGHSLPIASENLLTPIQLTDPDCPDQVVHGTYDSKWKLILKSGGLRPMGRQHVHFALGLPSKGGALHSQSGADTVPSSSAAIGVVQIPKGDENSGEQTADPTSTADETIIAPAPTLSPSTQPLASATQNPDPQPIISGMRATASVLIWVDLKRSLEAGALTWWRSANGVVLTEGDAERKVGLEWVERVERRGGGVIWGGGSLRKEE